MGAVDDACTRQSMSADLAVIVRTNNNAPFVTLRNCEERCRLGASGQKGQPIRVLGRTTVRWRRSNVHWASQLPATRVAQPCTPGPARQLLYVTG
jgi:hypothetical protein